MQFKAVLKVLGMLLTFFSFSMLVPVFVALYFHDTQLSPYIFAFLLTFVVGLALWLALGRHNVELKVRDGFLIVLLFWTVLSAFSSLPFLLALHHHFTFTDALFESVSGFTTTGMSAIDNLDRLPPALLYYRQQLQFLGGMGIIVLAVAILPLLGVGGMQLYKAETPGPMKDEKLTPRIAETAKAVWFIYVGLVVLCALSFWAAGMPVFDAVEEAFATISTGGFSTHNSSFAYYHSSLIDLIAVFYMFLGGVNFSLHYLAAAGVSLKAYWRDVEFRYYVWILFFVCLIVTSLLAFYQVYHDVWKDFVEALFNIVSIATTTGFVAGAYTQWPLFIPFLLMLIGLIGACGGSTSGGFKILRVVIIKSQVTRELRRLIHPQAIYPIRLGRRILSDNILEAVWAFAAAYFGIFILGIILVMSTGVDLESAFGACASALGNIGAGIGKYAYSLAAINTFSKWVLIILMLAGRLEVFTLIIIFSRTFWKR